MCSAVRTWLAGRSPIRMSALLFRCLKYLPWFVRKWMDTYTALQGSDKQTVQDLACLVAVADILECLGGVLTTNVQEDLLTTSVQPFRLAPGTVEWAVLRVLRVLVDEA